MARQPERAKVGDDPHQNRDWWARLPDDRRGDYPGPDDTDDEQARDNPRNSSQFPSPPADETVFYCEGCGRPMESGDTAYCDACTARGRHWGAVQEDQLNEPPSQRPRSSTGQPEQAPTQPEQPTALAEHMQAIAYGIDPAVLTEPGTADGAATEIRLACPQCGEVTRHVVDRYLATLEEAADTPAGRLTDLYAKQRQQRLGAASLQCTKPGCTHTQPRGPTRPQ